jgi:folate-binding protein YgfZ
MAIGLPGFESAPASVDHRPAEEASAAWRAVLERSGARFDASGVVDFGRAELERERALSGDVVAELSHFGLIEARGEDAQKFLASLFTGDVRLVSPERGQFTTWCDAKGRARASFWVFMYQGAYYLLLPQPLVQSALAGLKQYLLRVKVTLRDASDSFLRLGLSGPSVKVRLSALLGTPPPSQVGAAQIFDGCTLIAITGHPHPRWLAMGSVDAIADLWQKLSPEVLPVGREAWSLLDILAGIPLLVPETAGEFIPQMLNIEALGGLCFTKGCYPGQEVIARLHYRGQLKRRLYLAFADSQRVPSPGTALHRDGAAESAGAVVSAAWHPDGRVALLAVVKNEDQALGAVRLENAQGPILSFVE